MTLTPFTLPKLLYCILIMKLLHFKIVLLTYYVAQREPFELEKKSMFSVLLQFSRLTCTFSGSVHKSKIQPQAIFCGCRKHSHLLKHEYCSESLLAFADWCKVDIELWHVKNSSIKIYFGMECI